MLRIRRIAAAASVLLTASLAVTACGVATSAQGSRAELYSDLAALIADSAAVVEVEVQRQQVLQDQGSYTLSTVTVVGAFAPEGLAPSPESPSTFSADDEIVVRQMGSMGLSGTPAPLMEVGEEYLLFLTPTMLDGDASSQFYVVGASAGLYVSEAGTYTRLQTDDGDDLPATLTASDLD